MKVFKRFILIVALAGLVIAAITGSEEAALVAVVASSMAVGIAIGEMADRK